MTTGILCSLLAFAISPAFAKVDKDLFAIVNFADCMTNSKYGKQEQTNFENVRKQVVSMIEDTEKDLKELSQKFEDPEYLDSLSPKAEEELKIKYQSLNEDLARYQNQYYQVLQHAQMQSVQKLNATVGQAAEKIAKDKGLSYVVNKEFCFYYKPELEITNSVITEMDKIFEVEQKEAKELSVNSASEEFSENNASEEDFLDFEVPNVK